MHSCYLQYSSFFWIAEFLSAIIFSYLKDFFNISYKTDLLVIKSFSLCMLGQSLYFDFALLLKDILTGYRFLGCFIFEGLKNIGPPYYDFHWFWGKTAVIFNSVPIFIINFFFPFKLELVLRFLFIISFREFDYAIFWYMFYF